MHHNAPPDWTPEQVEHVWTSMNSPVTKSFLRQLARRQGLAGYDYAELCADLGGKSDRQIASMTSVITATSNRLGYEYSRELVFDTRWKFCVYLHEPWIHFIDRIEGRSERIEVELDDFTSDKINRELIDRYGTHFTLSTPASVAMTREAIDLSDEEEVFVLPAIYDIPIEDDTSENDYLSFIIRQQDV